MSFMHAVFVVSSTASMWLHRELFSFFFALFKDRKELKVHSYAVIKLMENLFLITFVEFGELWKIIRAEWCVGVAEVKREEMKSFIWNAQHHFAVVAV